MTELRPTGTTAPACPGSGQPAPDADIERCTSCGRQLRVIDGRIKAHGMTVFSAPWLVPDHDWRPEIKFTGTQIAGGFLCSRRVVDRIVDLHDELSWDGAVLVVDGCGRFLPDPLGRYVVGWGWAWRRMPACDVMAVAS